MSDKFTSSTTPENKNHYRYSIGSINGNNFLRNNLYTDSPFKIHLKPKTNEKIALNDSRTPKYLKPTNEQSDLIKIDQQIQELNFDIEDRVRNIGDLIEYQKELDYKISKKYHDLVEISKSIRSLDTESHHAVYAPPTPNEDEISSKPNKLPEEREINSDDFDYKNYPSSPEYVRSNSKTHNLQETHESIKEIRSISRSHENTINSIINLKLPDKQLNLDAQIENLNLNFNNFLRSLEL
ncbi:hypothetical protein WICMUC_004919 [Wickerhamomyces mucosus]|uniref:Uncharacterized protein n=1 Tax=Wickerhamomyces mucosus TaxID=1378264 RepID=A0A9P8T9Q8_9ASCO|nr:hypothetical protein WICMUC_004919 [Wickerhamomyces mucosus]